MQWQTKMPVLLQLGPKHLQRRAVLQHLPAGIKTHSHAIAANSRKPTVRLQLWRKVQAAKSLRRLQVSRAQQVWWTKIRFLVEGRSLVLNNLLAHQRHRLFLTNMDTR